MDKNLEKELQEYAEKNFYGGANDSASKSIPTGIPQQPSTQKNSSPGIVYVDSGPREIVVTDIRMPFWSMVLFMIKWALASIPAAIILFGLAFTVILLVGGFLSALINSAIH